MSVLLERKLKLRQMRNNAEWKQKLGRLRKLRNDVSKKHLPLKREPIDSRLQR